MDCKYALRPDSPEPFCKYTNGERLFDTTNPDEQQHAPFKNRAKVRIFPGNICRLLFKNLPKGKSNFTCNIKYADSTTASKTSVVEKSKLPVLLAIGYHSRVQPVILKRKTFDSLPKKMLFSLNLRHFSDCRAPPPLLGVECPITKLQWPSADLDDTSYAAGNSLAVNKATNC